MTSVATQSIRSLALIRQCIATLLFVLVWISPAHAQQSDARIETAKSLIRAFHDRNLAAWERSLAPGFVANYPAGPNLNLEQARAFNQVFIDAFPDLRFEIHHAARDGDTVFLDTTGTGTFSRPMVTPEGTIAPTGKSGVIRIVFIVDVKNGRISTERTVWNRMDLLTQLGLLK